MYNRIFRYAEEKIRATVAFYTLLALLIPVSFYGLVVCLNVSFDNAVLTLMGLLSLLILFIAYHEGRVAVSALRRYRLEMNEEHLLKIQDRRRELIPYGDIECVKVVKGYRGTVKRLKIVTPYRQMTISGYESLEQLAEYLQSNKGIVVKGLSS